MTARDPGVVPWLTGNTRVSYPFCPTEGDQLGPDDIRTLVVDALVRYTAAPVEGDALELVRLDYDGEAVEDAGFGVELRWASDQSVFFNSGSGATYTVHAAQWGPWAIVEWKITLPAPAVVRLVLHAARLSDFVYPVVPAVRCQLLARTVGKVSPRVSGLAVRNPPWPPQLPVLTGHLKLVAGYNMRIGVGDPQSVIPDPLGATSFARTATRVTIDPQVGAGLGREVLSDEPDASLLRTVNGVGPDDSGDFKVQMKDGCYWLEIPITDNHGAVRHALIRWHGDCAVCCSCQDYVDHYAMLGAADLQLRQVHEKLQAVGRKYAELRAGLEANQPCPEAVYATVDLYPKWGWSVNLQVTVFNATPCAVTSTQISVSGMTAVVPGNIVAGSGWGMVPAARFRAQDSETMSVTREIPAGSFMVFELEWYYPKHDLRVKGQVVGAQVSVTCTTAEGTAYQASAAGNAALLPPFTRT
jgi:hypothetical protein